MARYTAVGYYTPSIEEFCVGFEYEIKDWWTGEGKMGWNPNATPEEIEKAKNYVPIPDGFTKRVLTKSMLWEQSRTSTKENELYKAIINDEEYNPTIGADWRHEWERITTGIKDGTVRVKKLDQQDFKELGFSELPLPEGFGDSDDRYYCLEEEDYTYSITKEGDRYRIFSTLVDQEDVLFFGKIRNKFELSKIFNKVKWDK